MREKKLGLGGRFFWCAGVFFCAAFCLAGCGKEETDAVVLRVANWEEYMDEGGWPEEDAIELEDTTVWGREPMIEEFEEWYEETYGQEVQVEYSTFGTNEDLYNQLSIGDTFDVVCPSEYMIMKLLQEGEVCPFSEGFFDASNEENMYIRGVSPYIQDMLSSQEIDGKSLEKYAACFMWGTLGFVYVPDAVSPEEAKDWNLLRNRKYYKQVTTKDSIRDCYFAAAAMALQEELLQEGYRSAQDYKQRLSEQLNDTSQGMVDTIEELLTQVRENAYSFETDSGKADLVSGKVVANLQWSGDAVYSMEQAGEDGVRLKYAVPEACTNLWFDGWCMLKKGLGQDSRKQQAAEAFINYLSRPENVIRNMFYIGYTSAIAGGDSDLIFQYVDWYFGAEEDAEDTAEYPLGYFFSGREEDADYILTAEKEQLDAGLYAQYPPAEVLERSVVMACFDAEANRRVSRMWTNVRCFDWRDWFGR